MPTNFDLERRKQQRLRKLGSQTPQCAVCGVRHWECLELHHIEGQAYGSTLAIVCTNCHARLSVQQYGHPQATAGSDLDLTTLARLLSGIADLLELVVAKIRDAVSTLVSRASSTVEA